MYMVYGIRYTLYVNVNVNANANVNVHVYVYVYVSVYVYMYIYVWVSLGLIGIWSDLMGCIGIWDMIWWDLYNGESSNNGDKERIILIIISQLNQPVNF